jgi:RNA polymerase sigma-70 factor (ECF subfamily)
MNRFPETRESIATSQSLLRQLHADSPEAWDRLVMLYAPLVWHWCQRMDVPAQEIGDVLQEVFQSVAVHFPKFHRDRPGDTFRGWLRTITKNKVCDLFRAKQREPQAAGGTDAKVWWSRIPDSAGSIDQEGDEQELYRRALELIRDSFEEKTWRAFWSVVVEGRSPQEIALELGMSPGAVRVAKCRILHRLREELSEPGSDVS